MKDTLAEETLPIICKVMQSYHEAKLKEELIKFLPWVENSSEMVADMKFVNKIVDEYIKIRKL
jgi:hypothetical protein